MMSKAYRWLGMVALASGLAGCHNVRPPCPCPCRGRIPCVVRESTVPPPRPEAITIQKITPPLARVTIPDPVRILAPVAAPAHGGPHPGTIIGLVEMSAEEAKSIGVWPGKTPGAIFVAPQASTTKMMTVVRKPAPVEKKETILPIPPKSVEKKETILPIPPKKDFLAPTPPKPLTNIAPLLPSKKDPPSWIPPIDAPVKRVPGKQSSAAPVPQKGGLKARFWSWVARKPKPPVPHEGTALMGN